MLLLKVGAAGLGGGAEFDDVFLEGGELGGEVGVVVAVVREDEVAQSPGEFFEAKGLGRLALEGTDLATDLGDDVGDAG